jgi:hypothetical protein
MTKKIRDDVFHVTISHIGTDIFSQGFKRMEDTNPAKLVMRVVNLCANEFIGEENSKEKGYFFLSVVTALLELAGVTGSTVDEPLKNLLAKWEGFLNEFEQDEEKRKAFLSKKK